MFFLVAAPVRKHDARFVFSVFPCVLVSRCREHEDSVIPPPPCSAFLENLACIFFRDRFSYMCHILSYTFLFKSIYSLLLYNFSGTVHRRINIHPLPPPHPIPSPLPLPPLPPQIEGGASPSPPLWGGGGRGWGGVGGGGVCLYVCVMFRNINKEVVSIREYQNIRVVCEIAQKTFLFCF